MNYNEQLKTLDVCKTHESFNKGHRFDNILVESIRKLKCGRSIVVDNDYNVICGEKTLNAARIAGVKKIIVVETNGEELVVVKRNDITQNSTTALELSLVDNLIQSKNLQWDTDLLLDTVNKRISFNPHNWGGRECLVKDLKIEDLIKDDIQKVQRTEKNDNTISTNNIQQLDLFD